MMVKTLSVMMFGLTTSLLCACTGGDVTSSSSAAVSQVASSSSAAVSSVSSAMPSSEMSSSAPQVVSSSESSVASSAPGFPAYSDVTKPQNNNYDAPHATVTPVIDGEMDDVWNLAPWQAIDVLWLGAQTAYPSASDFKGRFKVLWDEDQLYFMADITDDIIFDGDAAPLTNYWNDDTVELFIDADKSGGDHQDENFDNAWAYHVSTLLDVVDAAPSRQFNSHITTKIKSTGTRHIWEMSIRIYDQGYNVNDPGANVPATLYAGKMMGFSASYIDSDNSLPTGKERESMMGSVNTQGHKNNLGYQNADVFGSLKLLE